MRRPGGLPCKAGTATHSGNGRPAARGKRVADREETERAAGPQRRPTARPLPRFWTIRAPGALIPGQRGCRGDGALAGGWPPPLQADPWPLSRRVWGLGCRCPLD
jgi:hypothetical protein